MRGALTLSELRDLADELGVDLDPQPYRMTNRPPPATSMNIVTALVSKYGDDVRTPSQSPPKGPMNVGAMRDSLRKVGIDLGHQREDAEDLEQTARHEAGHAVVAHGLGWKVEFCDARSGETKISQPDDYWEQRISDRLAQHNAIAAAGSVAARTSSWRDENLNDRVAVRMKGHTNFEDARKTAERLLADRWAKPALERLTRALRMVGRLEGAELLRVLEG